MRFGALCKDSGYTHSCDPSVVTKTGGDDLLPSRTSIPMYTPPFIAPPEAQVSPEQRETMNRLCQHIQEEKDSHAFDKLVKELNGLLEFTRDHAPGSQTDQIGISFG
jgi:hypothetical protein